jgi:hypothetical protein
LKASDDVAPPQVFILCTLTVSMANHWDVLREGSLTAALGGKQNAHDWIMGWTDLSLFLGGRADGRDPHPELSFSQNNEALLAAIHRHIHRHSPATMSSDQS